MFLSASDIPYWQENLPMIISLTTAFATIVFNFTVNRRKQSNNDFQLITKEWRELHSESEKKKREAEREIKIAYEKIECLENDLAKKDVEIVDLRRVISNLSQEMQLLKSQMQSLRAE